MGTQTKSANNNRKLELTISCPLETCITRLKKGYTLPYFDRNIRGINQFRTINLNKIDNNHIEFRATYLTKKGKRSRSVYISEVLKRKTAQFTQVTAQVVLPIRSMGCWVLFFLPIVILGFGSDQVFLVIVIYAVLLIIGFVVLLIEHKSTAPVSLKALSDVLEGRAYGIQQFPKRPSNG